MLFFLSFFLPLLTNYILRCYVLNMRRTGCFPNERFGFAVTVSVLSQYLQWVFTFAAGFRWAVQLTV